MKKSQTIEYFKKFAKEMLAESKVRKRRSNESRKIVEKLTSDRILVAAQFEDYRCQVLYNQAHILKEWSNHLEEVIKNISKNQKPNLKKLRYLK